MLEERAYACDRYDPLFARTRLWRNKLYDAVILHEVAEHLRRPAFSLTLAAERVAPAGIIALRTRFAPAAEQEFAAWWYRMDSTHVGFFTLSALCLFFEKRGFSLAASNGSDIAVFKREVFTKGEKRYTDPR